LLFPSVIPSQNMEAKIRQHS